MPIPYAVSSRGHASNAAHLRDAGGVSRDPALTSVDAAAHSAAPPETLRRIFLRANGDERRVMSLQVAWMVHVFTRDRGGARGHTVERPNVRAEAVRGDLPFDKAALKRAWATQFPHLLDDGRAGPAVRDLIAWCRARRAPAAATSLWHWLPLGEKAAADASVCAQRVMREWPASVLGVALTLSQLRNAVLPDLHLPNADLRGLVAPGADFRGSHFNGARWCGASLRGVRMTYANLLRADFERAELRESCFRATDISGARLVATDLRGAVFAHTVARNADFSEARCDGLVSTSARLDESSFHLAGLRGASLTGGSAHGARLVGAAARRSRWTAVAMRGARWVGADLRSAEFGQCDLRESDLRGAKLSDVHFDRCDLRNARFAGAALKRVRLGAGCQLAGTQWHGARIRLDDAWLRRLAPSALEGVVQSWMTLPPDQPATRAEVFRQLLIALGPKPGLLEMAPEAVPAMHRLPGSVRHSDWLGALLTASGEAGGVGEHEAFAGLRRQWLVQTLHELGDTPLPRRRAEWATAPLVAELHARCRRAGDEGGQAVWPLAGAVCQALHWTGEGVGQTDVRHVNALRAAWSCALPPGVRAALSADGDDPSGPGYSVLLREDGEVAARLPTALIRCVLGSVDGGAPEASDMSLACETLPGWRWRGTQVATRDPESAVGYGPGTIAHLRSLLREFGFLSGLWPPEPPLDAFVRLMGRWFGEEGRHRAVWACTEQGLSRSFEAGMGGVDGMGGTDGPVVSVAGPDANDCLSLADRREALLRVGRSPEQVRWLPAAQADVDDVFRGAPISASGLPGSSSLSAQEAALGPAAVRRARWAALAAALSWQATQPAWGNMPGRSGATRSADVLDACRAYAIAALNETMTDVAASRHLPQALALRACLADPGSATDRLALRLAEWLTCDEVRQLPGLAQACAQTLPWFWAIRLPLPGPATSPFDGAGAISDPTAETG
ncbi:Secreted effector protein PipB2 [Pandoraea morbifera]|uniref:Secreted effector protein PipB2 n=1 Tax=Pandoraea morbifera TaxID=2508300 RepID=A0A5E4WPH1_9BURK|nr:pentapeptide repeat-containing protein [Pandoraea morbifera]VVE25530.1 Secreted effector protein PipB2 [Pandoraea morbifera]